MNKNIKTGIYTKRNNGESEMINFNFSTNLRAIDKVRFVKNVTNNIVGDNFNIIIKDLIFDLYVIDTFTDVDLSMINEAKDSISAIEDFLANTNIIDIVVANMDDGLYDELVYAVNKNIDYQTGIHDNPIAESLSLLIKTIEKKIGSIDVDELSSFMKTVNNISGEMTTDKIMDAYTKTNAFKENQEKVQKEHKRHNKKIEGVAEKIMKDNLLNNPNN